MYSPTSAQQVTELAANGQVLSAGSGPEQAVPRRKRSKSLGVQAGKELVPAKIYRSTLHVVKILAACNDVPISVYLDGLVKGDLLREPDKVPQLLKALLAKDRQEPPESARPPQ